MDLKYSINIVISDNKEVNFDRKAKASRLIIRFFSKQHARIFIVVLYSKSVMEIKDFFDTQDSSEVWSYSKAKNMVKMSISNKVIGARILDEPVFKTNTKLEFKMNHSFEFVRGNYSRIMPYNKVKGITCIEEFEPDGNSSKRKFLCKFLMSKHHSIYRFCEFPGTRYAVIQSCPIEEINNICAAFPNLVDLYIMRATFNRNKQYTAISSTFQSSIRTFYVEFPIDKTTICAEDFVKSRGGQTLYCYVQSAKELVKSSFVVILATKEYYYCNVCGVGKGKHYHRSRAYQRCTRAKELYNDARIFSPLQIFTVKDVSEVSLRTSTEPIEDFIAFCRTMYEEDAKLNSELDESFYEEE